MKLELDVETLEFKISPTKKRPMKVDYLSDSREVLLVRRQTRPRRGEFVEASVGERRLQLNSSFSLRDGSRKRGGDCGAVRISTETSSTGGHKLLTNEKRQVLQPAASHLKIMVSRAGLEPATR